MKISDPSAHHPLYNSRIIDTYIKLIKRKYSYINVAELLSHAGMKPYEVADQAHWFSQEQIDRFYEKLVQMSGNSDIAREAGRYAASPEALGVMRQYVLGMIDPAKAYAMLGKAITHFTRSAEYQTNKVASNKIELTVIPRRGTREKSFQCENRLGFIEAISLAFRNKLPKIEHPECMFRGDASCRYLISWEKTPSVLLRRVRNIFVLILLAGGALLAGGYPAPPLGQILPDSLLFVMALTLAAATLDKRDLKKSLDGLVDSTDKLMEQIDRNYNVNVLTNEIGQAISQQTNIDSILKSVTQVLQKRLDYDRGLILLADQEKTALTLQAGFGYSKEQLELINKVTFHLDRPESKGVFVVSFREKRPFLINDLNEIEESLSSRSLAFAKRLGAQSFICCPIICEDESIGILAVDNLKSKRPLVRSDISLLMGIAPVIGISIRNADLLDARSRQLRSILQVLAASIDARDPLTAGHSEKVTEYALGICGELGLSQSFRELIRVAALLHDYGKIGVPDAILKKEGPLTEEEYEVVKAHSARTMEILEQINFEGILCQVPEIAGSHHEKLDGSGYPRGLKGREIPLGARIIAVADYFEAITAKRHYREPMPLEEAFETLRAGIGRHFEKRIVEALIHYYQTNQAGGPGFTGAPRRLRRVPCRTEVSLRVNGTVRVGTSQDLSLRGIYVGTEDEVPEGSPVELAFALPNRPYSSIRAKGRVVWVNNRREQRKSVFPTGFGVEFMEMQTMATAAIQSFVGAWMAAG